MVGGAPGEDVQTYLQNCPHIAFIGVNSYFCAQWRTAFSCECESEASISQLREPLLRYRVGRNLPAVTEINSGATPITARFAYIAVGEFGVPIFAPWALTVSYPETNQPYVLDDDTLANGAFALRDAYSSLDKALPQISYYATTEKAKVFMSRSPGQRFSVTEEVNGFPINMTGENNGQAIVIHPAAHDFLIVGYRASASFTDPAFQWPVMKQIHVQKVNWKGDRWDRDGEAEYYVDQSNKTLQVELGTPKHSSSRGRSRVQKLAHFWRTFERLGGPCLPRPSTRLQLTPTRPLGAREAILVLPHHRALPGVYLRCVHVGPASSSLRRDREKFSDHSLSVGFRTAGLRRFAETGYFWPEVFIPAVS